MGQKEFIISFALIFIFSISFISFAINFGTENDADINLEDDSSISSYTTTTESKSQSYQLEINGTLKAFQESEVTDTSETTKTGATFKDKENSPTGVFKDMLGVTYKTIFGADENYNVIFATIIATVLLIFSLLIWKTWKGGNPE